MYIVIPKNVLILIFTRIRIYSTVNSLMLPLQDSEQLSTLNGIDFMEVSVTVVCSLVQQATVGSMVVR